MQIRSDILLKFNFNLNIKNVPKLDKNFIPIYKYFNEFLAKADEPIAVALERGNNEVSVYETSVFSGKEMKYANKLYLERLVKFLLWSRGGYKIYICGDKELKEYIKETYSPYGKRKFDYEFMSRVYGRELTIEYVDYDKRPAAKEFSRKIGSNLEGCRIGFDAGGSDRKVSAVIDGERVFSEEVVWYPKEEDNPDYHYQEILKAFKSAVDHLPRVDAIGVSTAGIVVNNYLKASSLFVKVKQNLFEKKAKDIYIRAAKEIGDIPVMVANDGDVSALAGAMALRAGQVLGIAMGTSEAVGYVDKEGDIMGWLNELAFAPIDLYDVAMKDEWSGDIGVGCKYFSQDAVAKLAPVVGIKLAENLKPAQKLKEVQRLMEKNDDRARSIYDTIGCYLGHTIPFYDHFYDIKHIILLGRVTSNKGGDIILKTAKKVLKEEYPNTYEKIEIKLPDENVRRIGQSVAAASLPKLRNR